MERGHPLPSRLGGQGEYRSSASRVHAKALAKTKKVYHFLPEKRPLVNRMLLNVAKRCVTEELK